MIRTICLIGIAVCTYMIYKGSKNVVIANKISSANEMSIDDYLGAVENKVKCLIKDRYKQSEKVNVNSINFKDIFENDGYDKYEYQCGSNVSFIEKGKVRNVFVTYTGTLDDFKGETCITNVIDILS